MKILTSQQMRTCDELTIKQEKMHSRDLMMRASEKLFQAITGYCGKSASFHAVCGPGNNGGDGLCVAYLMASRGINVRASIILNGKKPSEDLQFYLNMFSPCPGLKIQELPNKDLTLNPDEILIDALFGTGLSTELGEPWKQLIEKLNHSGCRIISIDMPSGLTENGNIDSETVIRAEKVFTIQAPKPSLLYFENKTDFKVVDCGIETKSISCSHYYLDPDSTLVNWQLEQLIPARAKHSHKGNYGHALLIGGNKGMSGAISLAAKGCVDMGCGLTTVLSPAISAFAVANVSKAMHIPAELHENTLADLELKKYNAISIGPGMGNTDDTHRFLSGLLDIYTAPLIIDADALNIISQDQTLFKKIPKGSLLTPHPGELTRLLGKIMSGKERENQLLEISQQAGIFILAKDTYSMLACPDGKIFYNGTGGPHMAQGGSGDRLLGIITGLFARTNNMRSAALAGMYLAGK